MRRWALASVTGAAVVTLAVIAACGGSDGTDVTGGGTSSGTSGSPAGTSGGTTGGTSGGTSSGGAAADSPSDAPTTPVPTDGGTDPTGAGPGGTTSTLSCGTATCEIPAQTCCIQRVPGAGGTNFSCVNGTTCPGVDAGGGGGGDVSSAGLQCSSQANCAAGSVCCLTLSGGGHTVTSACVTGTACPQPRHQLCDPSASSTTNGCSADAGTCSSSGHGDLGLPTTFGACGGFPN